MEIEIGINDLPKYSPWCKKIMSLEEEQIHYKTPKEVRREYADEKWGEVCNILDKNPKIRLHELESKLFTNNKSPIFFNSKFILMSAWDARQKLYSLYCEKMKPYSKSMQCLVELGAGYGSVILNLLCRNRGGGAKAFSGEYTSSGLKAQSILAGNEGIDITTGECDFYQLTKSPVFRAAKHGVVFTSWAAAYVPAMTQAFVDYFLEFEPQYVIHFEPCYEFYSMDTLHGQMCRRYMQLNDYNRNLMKILREAEQTNKIEIMHIEKNFWGANPFSPISMIVWKPV